MEKAQGAIEYLLIIAAAILVVAIVILAVTGALSGGQDQLGFSNQAVFDATFPIKVQNGLGTTTATFNPHEIITGTSFNTLEGHIEGDIYVGINSVAKTQLDLQTAYDNGSIIIKINDTDAKTQGYTYTQVQPTQQKQIHLEYTASYDVNITFEKETIIDSITLDYIDYNNTLDENTPKDPKDQIYNITTCLELQNIKNELEGDYTLENNIDCSDTINWNNGKGFIPIGSESIQFRGTDELKFKGTFDGQNHTITNLYINKQIQDMRGSGLFGNIINATIKNVGLINNNMTTKCVIIGGIAGYVENSTITNTYTTGSINGTSNVGGLIGLITNSTITNNYTTGNTTGEIMTGGLIGNGGNNQILNNYTTGNTIGQSETGGIIGHTDAHSNIQNNYTTGNTSGETYTGGLIGAGGNSTMDNNIMIKNNYTTGTVTGQTKIGGLIGYARGLIVQNSYASGNITGTGSSIGGLVGVIANNVQIVNSFAAGEVSGVSSVGGLVGSTHGTTNTNNSFFSEGQIDTGPGDSVNPIYFVGAFGSKTLFLNWDKSIWQENIEQATDYPTFKTTNLPPAQIYKITTCQELQEIQNDLTGNYTLENNIDCSLTINWNNKKGFKPINDFVGTINGHDFAIKNLHINRPEEDSVGLIKRLYHNGKLNNITLLNANITGQNKVGSIMGQMTTGTNNSLTNSKCINCKIDGNSSTGGLIGQAGYIGSISKLQFNGNIEGNSNIGGIIGFIESKSGIDISNTFVIDSNIIGTNNVGGLIGACYGPSKLKNSYFSGKSTGYGIAGFAYHDGRTFGHNNYFDSTKSELNIACDGDNFCGEPKTTNEMKQKETYENWDLNIWNFDGINPPTFEKTDINTPINPDFELHTQIKTCQDLQNIDNALDKNYVLMNNIDCENFGDFEPMGYYYGIFEGNNKTINNLKIRSDSSPARGALFKYIGYPPGYTSRTQPKAGVIKNLKLKNTTILTSKNSSIARDYFKGAPLAIGVAYGSLVDNVTVENITYDLNLENTDLYYIRLGGLVSENTATPWTSATIQNSAVIGEINFIFHEANILSNPIKYFGGIVGQNSGLIKNSYFKPLNNISLGENSTIGGISSQASSGETINSTNYANLSGNVVGGISGTQTSESMINNSINFGNIYGKDTAGGITGAINNQNLIVYKTASIIDSKNEGTVSGDLNAFVGGIVGQVNTNLYGLAYIEGSVNDGEIIGSASSTKNTITGRLSNYYYPNNVENSINNKTILISCEEDCFPVPVSQLDDRLCDCWEIRTDVPYKGTCNDFCNLND